MSELYWDPFDVEIDLEPYGIWRRMRDDEPVYRNEQFDFWALSRFDDVASAHRDPQTFSSAHGTVLEIMGPNRMRGTNMMIFEDPPDHTQLRVLVSKAFTPGRVRELEDRIRELCVAFLDAQAGNASFDYLQDFGARLPAMVIASLLGVPLADQEQVRHLIDTTFHIEPGVGMINDISITAMMELGRYLAGQLEERRVAPRDDMFTDLVQVEMAQADGDVRRLTEAEAVGFASLLINAGPRPWPACSAGLRSCSPITPISGPSSLPHLRSSRPRSRNCCASRPRHRCRVVGRPARSTCTA